MEMFSIHRQTFDRWVQYRKLPLIRIGNRKWIKGDDLNRWLGEHSTHPNEEKIEEFQWRTIWGKK